MTDDPGSDVRQGGVLATISAQIASLHRQQYGRGGGRVRTIWEDDVVVTVLEEIFTPIEVTLVRAGRFEQVRATRQAFQDVMAHEMIRIVETATGRSVRAFVSQVHENPSMAVESFILGGALDASQPAPSDYEADV